MSNTPDTRPGASEEAIDKAPETIAEGVDEEVVESNRRLFTGWHWLLFAGLAIAYSSFHLISLNVYPMETWSFRLVHIAGALVLGFALYTGTHFAGEAGKKRSPPCRAGSAMPCWFPAAMRCPRSCRWRRWSRAAPLPSNPPSKPGHSAIRW